MIIKIIVILFFVCLPILDLFFIIEFTLNMHNMLSNFAQDLIKIGLGIIFTFFNIN